MSRNLTRAAMCVLAAACYWPLPASGDDMSLLVRRQEQNGAAAVNDVAPPESAVTVGDAYYAGASGVGCCEQGCGAACASGCCSGCCCDDQRLLGFIAPTPCGFDEFISPMTNPVYFEDPRTLTEARFIYLYHQIPNSALGGDINLFVVQLRAALTERLSIIATKDGFITSSSPLIDDGWADVNAGLKYNFYRDYANQTLVSGGVTYEFPWGSTRARQGNGDGLFNVFLTSGFTWGNAHWISAGGLLAPTNRTEESQLMYWSNHWDWRVGSTPVYLLTEVNWYHWTQSGQNGFPGIEEGSLFNFGSTGVAGRDFISGAVGFKLKPSRNAELGVAWETPWSHNRFVMNNRLTVDLILRY